LLVRGNWSKGFRAPSVGELFLGAFDVFANEIDPCSAGVLESLDASVQDRCYNGFAGIGPVPPGYETNNVQHRFIAGGNPELDPETAVTKTLGFAYSPRWLDGLDLSLDWHNIRVRGLVGPAGVQDLLTRCYVLGDEDSCRQGRLSRAPGGDLLPYFVGNVNLPGGIETEGYDFSAGYRIATPAGMFRWRWDVSYTSYFGELGQPDRLDCAAQSSDGFFFGDCLVELAGGNVVGTYAFPGIPYWRVRSNLATTWSYSDWNATVGLRYYSSLDEPCIIPFVFGFEDLCSDPDNIRELDADGIGYQDPRNTLGSRTYVDLQATWDAPWNARVTLGINNAFDRNPPIAYSAPQNSFDPAYPVPGRFWYAQYTQRF